MIRKFIAFFILLSMGISLPSYSSANLEIPFEEQMILDQWMGLHEYLQSEYDDASYKLLKLKNWREYKKQIDVFFLKNRKNTKRMRKLEQRLFEIQEKIYAKWASKKTIIIINYMQAKLAIIMEAIANKEIQEILAKEKKLAEEKFKWNISEKDKKRVEKEVLALQKNLLNYGNDTVKQFIGDFEKLTKRKETWDFKMTFLVDGQQMGKTSGELKFSDYEAKSDLFDSKLTGYIDGFIKSSIKGENTDFQIKSFIDFISKDGNMYILMDKLNFTYTGKDQNISKKILPYIEKIKQYAKENKYIKLEDPQTQKFLKQIEKINIKDFSNKIQISTKVPFFEAYKKEGNKYILKPTKHFCSVMKDITERFDPFYGSKCSDKQYENMLTDMANLWWELSLSIWWNVNTLWYTMVSENWEINTFIKYTKKSIENVSVNIIPNQRQFPNEELNLEYKRKSHLNFYMLADDLKIDFIWKLNFKNKLDKIDSSITFKWKRIWSLTLRNKKIEWNIDYVYQSYDWNTGEFTDSNRTLVNLTGKWNGKNFDTMDLKMSIQDLRDTSNYWEVKVSYGAWSRNSLKANGLISIEWKKIFTIETNGKLEKKYLDIKNNIIFKDSSVGFFFPNETQIDIDFDIMSDFRNNKNNSRVYINAQVWEKTPLELEIENTGTVGTFKWEIQAPQKFIKLEDIDGFGKNIRY